MKPRIYKHRGMWVLVYRGGSGYRYIVGETFAQAVRWLPTIWAYLA